MKQLNQDEIKKLDALNSKLISVEKNIYTLALKHNQKALKKLLKKEHNILDYELEISFLFYAKESLLAEFTSSVKSIFMQESWWGINDNNCHNTTSVFQKNKALNGQKHCFLLHELYDHQGLDWDEIFKIGSICFDIKIQYEYEIKIT